MKYYVYSHIQADTGEVFYIGKGKGIRAYSNSDRSKWWKNVANKHGWKAVIICDDLTEDEAFEVEKFYIKHYGRRDLGTGTLVNMTDGGEGLSGNIRSEETRKKMSESKKGKVSPFKGRVVSEETRKKMSEAKKGKVYSSETRRKMSESKKGKVSPWKGRSASAETRKKMSDAWKDRKKLLESTKVVKIC